MTDEMKSTTIPDYPVMVKNIFIEAKKESSKLFKQFLKEFKLELEYTTDDELQVANLVLQTQYQKYEKELNIKDIKHAKQIILKSITGSNDVYDKERNFHQDRFDIFQHWVIRQMLVLKEIEYLKEFINDLKEDSEPSPSQKINFLGNPSQLGYLIGQLIEKNYIEKPSAGKDIKSLRKMAKIFYRNFYIKDSKSKGETTFENFYKEIYANSLSKAGKEWVIVRIIS